VSSSSLTCALQSLIGELERDLSLDEPDRLRERIEALDRLEAYLLDGVGEGVYSRARAIYAKLERANFEAYQSIRRAIQLGAGPDKLRQWMPSSANGEGYDYLDELVSGILHFDGPDPGDVRLPAEMVSYQPTPARHIFDLIGRTALTARDVLIDLGSGLGHVPLLVSICTEASSIGIELEAAYVDCARTSAQALNLKNVTFIEQDARLADLSAGTVFYLYTPFTGSILREVLDSLRRESSGREIRVCALGPCVHTIAQERWLKVLGPLQTDRIALFCSSY
jgi:hypothetical protein